MVITSLYLIQRFDPKISLLNILEIPQLLKCFWSCCNILLVFSLVNELKKNLLQVLILYLLESHDFFLNYTLTWNIKKLSTLLSFIVFCCCSVSEIVVCNLLWIFIPITWFIIHCVISCLLLKPSLILSN